MEKNVQRAIELWTKAAELGSNKGHFELGRSYYNGDGVGQDKVKAVEHWERAAMNGHIESRHSLGVVEYNAGNYHLAVEHFLISAKMGDKDSLDEIKEMFTDRIVTKEQYADAKRAYQEAVEETKSHQREEAIRRG